MFPWGHLSWAQGSDPEKQAKAKSEANEEVLNSPALDSARCLLQPQEGAIKRAGSVYTHSPSSHADLARPPGKALQFGAAEKYLGTSSDQNNGHNDEGSGGRCLFHTHTPRTPGTELTASQALSPGTHITCPEMSAIVISTL